MHITLWLNSHESDVLRLPAANLHLFQSLLYKLLPHERAAFLHDEGYRVDGKPMKLFAMSWPLSEQRPKFLRDRIELKLPVRLVVSTSVETTLDGLADGALKGERLRIGSNSIVCERVEAKHYEAKGDCIRVRTLSPVTCYSQMQRGDGRRYTVYFSPREKDFSLSVHNNLIRKFRALYPERELPDGEVSIEPVGQPRERVAKFSESSGFPIKGWDGAFTLTGPQALLQIALDCGIGAKNSGGFGCITLH